MRLIRSVFFIFNFFATIPLLLYCRSRETIYCERLEDTSYRSKFDVNSRYRYTISSSVLATIPSQIRRVILAFFQTPSRALHQSTRTSNEANPASLAPKPPHTSTLIWEIRTQLSPFISAHTKHIWATTTQSNRTGHRTKRIVKRNTFIQSPRSTK